MNGIHILENIKVRDLKNYTFYRFLSGYGDSGTPIIKGDKHLYITNYTGDWDSKNTVLVDPKLISVKIPLTEVNDEYVNEVIPYAFTKDFLEKAKEI